MGKVIAHTISWLIIPALIVGHILTQHAAFIYLFGLMAVLFTVIGVITISAIIMTMISKEMLPEMPVPKWWRLLITLTYNVVGVGYMLYVDTTASYVAATLYFIQVLVAWTLIGVLKVYQERRAATIEADAVD